MAPKVITLLLNIHDIREYEYYELNIMNMYRGLIRIRKIHELPTIV